MVDHPGGREHGPSDFDPLEVRERGLFSSEPEMSNTGPRIDVQKPRKGELSPSPLEIIVEFEPRKADVDLTTLEVTLMKFINIDLTDRVRPYVTPKGIHVQQANLPSGDHTVRLSVGDTEGGRTTTLLNVRIKD